MACPWALSCISLLHDPSSGTLLDVHGTVAPIFARRITATFRQIKIPAPWFPVLRSAIKSLRLFEHCHFRFPNAIQDFFTRGVPKDKETSARHIEMLD